MEKSYNLNHLVSVEKCYYEKSLILSYHKGWVERPFFIFKTVYEKGIYGDYWHGTEYLGDIPAFIEKHGADYFIEDNVVYHSPKLILSFADENEHSILGTDAHNRVKTTFRLVDLISDVILKFKDNSILSIDGSNHTITTSYGQKEEK